MQADTVTGEDATGSEQGRKTPFEAATETWWRDIDPFGVVASILRVQETWISHPQEMSRAMAYLSEDMSALNKYILRRSMGLPAEEVVTPHPDDTRFLDKEWSVSPAWNIIKQAYLALTHYSQDIVYATPDINDKQKSRAAFWLRFWLNALAPTNFFLSNPVALRKYIESNGKSLVDGMRNFQRDMLVRDIQMTEPGTLEVGKDLATTMGNVIFRNDLIELIYYTPTTPKVHKKPIVIVTPWINKYYVLDLKPEKSMIKYLVDNGYPVFVTSWKNPDAAMRNVSYDDYLEQGAQTAVNVACEYYGGEAVHLTGYCIGGTLSATYMAWANKRFAQNQLQVADWTLFTTLVDFTAPGDIDVFVDEATVSALEKIMGREGYLDGQNMAAAFRMLRSNSLIWHYWVSSYLYGEELKPFDVLTWNMDSTRMTAAMHGFYLRQMYLNNNLIKRNKLTIAGERIDLGCIKQPLYMVSAEDDHITPWKECYRTQKYVKAQAPVRFVLSSSGHIQGIINPDINPPRRNYRADVVKHNERWESWLKHAKAKQGSWWADWLQWLGREGGNLVTPPAASKKYPAICPAPGTYVLE